MPLPSHLHFFHVLNTTGCASQSRIGSSLFIPTATTLSPALLLIPENRSSLPHSLWCLFIFSFVFCFLGNDQCSFQTGMLFTSWLCSLHSRLCALFPRLIHLIYFYIIYCSNRCFSHSCPLWGFWYILIILPTYQVLLLFFKYFKIFHIYYINFILFILLYILFYYYIT